MKHKSSRFYNIRTDEFSAMADSAPNKFLKVLLLMKKDTLISMTLELKILKSLVTDILHLSLSTEAKIFRHLVVLLNKK